MANSFLLFFLVYLHIFYRLFPFLTLQRRELAYFLLVRLIPVQIQYIPTLVNQQAIIEENRSRCATVT